MDLPTTRVTLEQMTRRVARFSELRGFSGGLPDSHYPGAQRTLFNIISAPLARSDVGSHVPPAGFDAAANAAIEIAEGFNLGIAKARPGNGPLMHNHDTNETFMPLTGTWRVSWEVNGEVEHFDLAPYDVISVPSGLQRRFVNVTIGAPEVEHMLLAIIAGDNPKAEFSPSVRAELLAKGYVDAHGSVIEPGPAALEPSSV